jgi:ABC-type glycerol-3-phosphate transport system permease component
MTTLTAVAQRRRKSRFAQRGRDLVVLTGIFTVLFLFVLPFLWVVLTSFRPGSSIMARDFEWIPTTLTLDNFTRLLQTDFLTHILNSIIVSLPTTLFAVTVSLTAAYSFSRRSFRWRNQLLILVVFSQLFPFVILITPIYMIFQQLGLVNTHLGLMISYIAITVPFSVYMLLGYLDSVPRELDEAAIIDGCSTLGVIFRIIVPVAWPGIAATAIFTFTLAWNEFLFASALVTRTELKTIQVALASLIGENSSQWDLIMAGSVLASLPTMLMYLFLQRHMISGLTAGSVK